MADQHFEKNMAAMQTGGQTLALEWLQTADGWAVEEVEAASGDTVLMVSGQSQASRHDPCREAEQWLERQRANYKAGGAEAVCLFGGGNPWVVLGLLAEKGDLTLFEPNPRVLRSVFKHHDFAEALSAGRLKILTPWDIADGRVKGLAGALVLAHPPAQRRDAAQLLGLQKAISGHKPSLSGLVEKLRILVVPPLSGGSWPVAVSLAKAVTLCGHELMFMDWDFSLKQREVDAHNSTGTEKNKIVSALFETAAETLAAAATDFQPHLIIALAQAPLDAAGLAKLRDKTEAPAAFWLVEDVRNFAYVEKVAASYDAFFHIQEGMIEPYLRAWGISQAHYLPMAADAALFQPLPQGANNSYAAALSFMGAGYPNRKRLMAKLAENFWPQTGRPTEDFKIFGSGWTGISRALKRHIFENGRRVSLPECVMIYAGGQVNLNIHSSFQSEPLIDPSSAFVNPRTFEIAAAGSFQLVDARPLLPPLFENGRELVTVKSADELPGLITHYLNHPAEAAATGQAARARVLKEHTYQHRLERLLALLGWAGQSATL